MQDDHVTSLDMVKIGFKSKADITCKLIQGFWDSHLDQGEHWMSSRYSDFEHIWTFPSGSSVVTVMYAHNSQAGRERKTGAIEWNPNKVDFESTPDLWMLIKNLLMTAKTFELTKADIAYDLPGISIHQCTIDKGLKAHAQYFMGNTDSMTIYAGARGSAGSCKVYDKRREVMDHGGEDPGVLTRYEVTYKANLTYLHLSGQEFEYVGGVEQCTIPHLVIMNQPEVGQPLSPEDHLLVAGLQELPHLFNLLSKYQRNRIKGLKCSRTFAPSISEAETLLMPWFQSFHKSIIA